MIVTDWNDIDNLYFRDHIASSKKDAIIAAASGARTGSVMDQFAGGAAQDDGVRDITPDDFDRKAFLETALEQYRKLQKACQL